MHTVTVVFIDAFTEDTWKQCWDWVRVLLKAPCDNPLMAREYYYCHESWFIPARTLILALMGNCTCHAQVLHLAQCLWWSPQSLPQFWRTSIAGYWTELARQKWMQEYPWILDTWVRAGKLLPWSIYICSWGREQARGRSQGQKHTLDPCPQFLTWPTPFLSLDLCQESSWSKETPKAIEQTTGMSLKKPLAPLSANGRLPPPHGDW